MIIEFIEFINQEVKKKVQTDEFHFYFYFFWGGGGGGGGEGRVV